MKTRLGSPALASSVVFTFFAFLSSFTLIATGPGIAHAEGEPRPVKDYEISGMAGIQWGGSPTSENGSGQIEAGLAYGGILGVRIRPDSLIVLAYHRQTTEIEVSATGFPTSKYDVDVGYVQIGGELDGAYNRWLRPFVGITIGATHITPHESGVDSEWFFSGSLYAGAKFPLNDHFGLRTQLRMHTTLLAGNAEWFCSSSFGCLVSTELAGMIQGDLVAGVYFAF